MRRIRLSAAVIATAALVAVFPAPEASAHEGHAHAPSGTAVAAPAGAVAYSSPVAPGLQTVRNVHVVFVPMQGAPAPDTEDAVRAKLAGASEYWRGMSHRRIGFRVASVQTAPVMPNSCDYTAVYATARRAFPELAREDGDILLAVRSAPVGCVSSASAMVGASPLSAAPGRLQVGRADGAMVYAHELGHVLGLTHANAGGQEYGNGYSLMGKNITGPLTASETAILGLWDRGEVITLRPGRTVRIRNTAPSVVRRIEASASPRTRLLDSRRYGQAATVRVDGVEYWVEQRDGVGVLLTRVGLYSLGKVSSDLVAVLKPGQSVTVPGGQFSSPGAGQVRLTLT